MKRHGGRKYHDKHAKLKFLPDKCFRCKTFSSSILSEERAKSKKARIITHYQCNKCGNKWSILG